MSILKKALTHETHLTDGGSKHGGHRVGVCDADRRALVEGLARVPGVSQSVSQSVSESVSQ